MFTSKCQVDEFNSILCKLRIFCRSISQEKEENGEQTLAFIEEVAKEVPPLYQLPHDINTAKYRVSNGLLLVIMRIVLFKAKSFLMELVRGDSSPMALWKDQLEILLEGLELYTAIVTRKQLEITANVELILKDIESVARGISSLFYLFVAKKITEEMINNTIISFSDLQDKMKLIKTKLMYLSRSSNI